MLGCCTEASKTMSLTDKTALKAAHDELGLPHDETTLALLVNVHIVGGSKDLAFKLKGLTMRVSILERLMEVMRSSGGSNAPHRSP